MNEIKKFEYEGNEITFLTGSNTMVNATEMANYFDVKPNFWLKTDAAQRMINKYAELKNINTADLVQIRQGGNDKSSQGTWMHEDIALVFAQWLSPEFYFWCNDRIKELFKYGITATQEKAREIAIKLGEATNRLKENSGCKTGRYKIYEELRLRGILNEHNKPVREYVDKGYFKYEPYGKNSLSRYVTVTEEGLKWLNQAFYPDQNVSEDYLELKTMVVEMQHDQELLLEGITVIAETMFYNKGGVRTEEQNRVMMNQLHGFIEKAKRIQLALKQ